MSGVNKNTTQTRPQEDEETGQVSNVVLHNCYCSLYIDIQQHCALTVMTHTHTTLTPKNDPVVLLKTKVMPLHYY